MKRNKKWTLCCFGDENLENYPPYLYGTTRGECKDYSDTLFPNLRNNTECYFGEIWSKQSCVEAHENRRIFSYRIKI